MESRIVGGREVEATGLRRVLPGGVAPKKVVVIGSLAWSLVNFRLDLMKRMVACGHSVVAVAPDLDPAVERTLAQNGIASRSVRMDRTGLNPFRDAQTVVDLVRVLRKEAPDLVLSYTMKPNVYGSLAARLASVDDCYVLFTGLGYAFSEENPSGRRRMVRLVTTILHRIALRKVKAAFCYNSKEHEDIRRHRLVPASVPLHDVPGTGVDVQRFRPSDPPRDPVRFLYVGRLLRSKGLELLAEASARLRAEGRAFQVDLVGPFDSNPDAVDDSTLAAWKERGLLFYHGSTTDVAPHYQECSVFILPTFLREGLPRTILEAMASGRAVITTDAPGCGETIVDGVSGLVVPRGDAGALAAAMATFIDDPELASRMGRAARAQVCERHDVHLINRLLLTRMELEASSDLPRERESAA